MTTLNLEVQTDSDSADEQESTGTVDIGATVLEFRSHTADGYRYWPGLRWETAALSQGDTINSATLSIHVVGTSNDDVNGNLHFELGAAPATFTTTTSDITDRDRTSESVPWVADSLGGGRKTSPSLVSPLQEVVDAYTPTALVIIGRPNTNADKRLTFYTYDLDPYYTEGLDIDYTAGGPAAIVRNYLTTLGVS